ncbi:PLP-dependent transferase [Teratosphaeria destructans]|uniref:PLP-dependent transferase n=1 Tax=Teratosphaeria destructans TaxID=418781 RepID=A0A9W7ST76_9PEZI|nr:PLP-dependent transferase [Teratosphaeria destructans]
MPQEHKKRGRRMKRKHGDGEDDPVVGDAGTSKRKKSADGEQDVKNADVGPIEGEAEDMDGAYPPVERAFFGMLDEEEQEYFKRADDVLEANAFGDSEERDLFLANVYREAEGKELKIAQSQSCSRLMEKLIQLSNAKQLKQLFQAFSGNFIHLFSHRFASHCCEALFLQAAPLVSQELLTPASNGTASIDEIYVSLENLFLHTLAELEGSVGYLMTDQYASHVLRVLLLVLSGEPLDQSTQKHILQSKRKEAITVEGNDSQGLEKSRAVPKSFMGVLEKLIADSVAGLDTEKLRALATHPNGSPTLQLLLKIELTHFGKQRAKDQTSILRTLLPDDPITSDSGSAAFISGLVYDTVGSHLVEQIVTYAPGKTFKNLMKEFFKERLASFARNEIAAYVVCRILERLSKDDLYEAHEILIPVAPSLLERNRTVVLRTLIERCVIRDVDTQVIAATIDNALQDADGFDVKKLLKLEQPQNEQNGHAPHDGLENSATDAITKPQDRSFGSAQVHFNKLAQAMLLVPGPLSSLILDSLVKLDPQILLKMAEHPIICRTIQAALTTKNASIITRRKLIQHYYGHIGELALDKNGSHVVDCIWEGTHGLAFIRERIAEELAENEPQLRESSCGRAVWKNWKMDLYKRRRQDWVKQSRVKASNDGFQSFSEIDKGKKLNGQAAKEPAKGGSAVTNGVKKTPLELARERHAKRKAEKASKEQKSVSKPSVGKRPKSDAAAAPGASATAAANGQQKPLRRAEETDDLLCAVKDSIVQFIRSADEDALTKSSGHGLQQPGQGPRANILEHHPPKKLQKLLDLTLPDQPQGKDGLLQVIEKVHQYSVNTWDQGFLDKLYASITPVGLAADLLLSSLNTNVHVYQVSPVLTVIEKQTAKALATLFGLQGSCAGGVSQPGGSAANQSSMVIARNNLFPETKGEGYGSKKFVLFTSAHGHYSVEKAAQMFGFGSKAVRSVPVDGQGRMKPQELDRMVEESKQAGETPFYINATAGTTVLGSYDPLDEISAVAKKHGLWLHVDGSWGGPAIFSEKQRHNLKGSELADSITLCPHKMMNIPLTCTFLLAKDLREFHKGMTLPAGYLFHGNNDESAVDTETVDAHPNQEAGVKEVWDLADLTPQCGRRGDALKLALSWIYYGTSGLAAYIDNAFETAAYFASAVSSNAKFSLVSEDPPPCLQVAFYFGKEAEGGASGWRERNSKRTAEITKALIPRGFMIDYAPGEEGSFFRVVVNGQTTRGTVDGLLKAIEEVGDGLKL